MRKLILILSMLCLCLGAGAQRFAPYRQYVTLNAGIGLNGYGYKLAEDGSKDLNGGVMARLGYHFIKRDCGFWAGMMIESFNSNAIVSYDQRISGAVDQEGGGYVHVTRFSDWEENHKQLILSIPLEFNYRFYLGDGMKLLLGVGPLLQFSIKNSYRITSGHLQTMMYYPEYDLLVDELAPQHHLYTASGFNGEYKLKFSPGMVFDAGILYPLEKNFELNLGFYGTMSLASQTEGREAGPYDPDCMAADAYTDARYYGVFNSNVTNKLKPFSIGIQVGLYYYIPYSDKDSKAQ